MRRYGSLIKIEPSDLLYVWEGRFILRATTSFLIHGYQIIIPTNDEVCYSCVVFPGTLTEVQMCKESKKFVFRKRYCNLIIFLVECYCFKDLKKIIINWLSIDLSHIVQHFALKLLNQCWRSHVTITKKNINPTNFPDIWACLQLI